MRLLPLVCASILLLSDVTRAQSEADRLSADDALQAAAQLRDAGQLPEAVAKYKAAHAFAPTPLTDYELGRAYADTGALTEAYEVLTGIAKLPPSASEPTTWSDARAAAAKLAEAVKARMPALTLTVIGIPADAPITVTIDGKTIHRATLGAARRMNPGHHVIAVKLEGGGEAHTEITLREQERRELPIHVTAQSTSRSDEVSVSFVLPEHFDTADRDTWVLHAPDGARVCTLPCEPQVTPARGYFLQLTRVNASGSVDIKRVEMSPSFAGLPPGRWYAVPHEGRGNPLVAGLMLIPAVPASFFGVVGGVSLIGFWMHKDSDGAALAGGVALLGGIAALMTAHTFWLVWSRNAGVTIKSTVKLTPTGIAGTF